MSALLWSILFALLPAESTKPAEKLDRDTLIKAARPVVKAIVDAGRANRLRAEPYKGDELTRYYVRAAATAAGKLPEKQAAPGFLLAIGVALDSSDLLRTNPVTAATWKRVETDAERTTRLKVLGTPTMHGRHDLAQHFVVSAALTATSGSKAAEVAGLLKEMLDAEPGGSGFSFADLASDLSGIAFAEHLLGEPARLRSIARNFTVSAFGVPPKGLTEGLSREEFEKSYGGLRDKRFRKEFAALRKKVRELPGYKREGK